MGNGEEKIRITWDDLNAAPVFDPAPITAAAGHPIGNPAAGSWGSISNAPATQSTAASSAGSVWLKGWFYLGAAGLGGALLAWMICEPTFFDGSDNGFGNYMLFPLMVILMCVGLGTAESVVERSWQRALQKALASTGLGLVLGFIFNLVAGVIFHALVMALFRSNPNPDSLVASPALWISRAFAWAVFGMAGGLVFGIVSKSGKKIVYGMLGGVIGAGLGGLLFDPISLITGGAEASRMIGMSILGACTGVAIGLVENALKDRWLYVSSGPLAGKQFVLYQDQVTIGKNQSSTIFLFKDPDVLNFHAIIENRSGKSFLTAHGPVVISGQVLQGGTQRPLNAGDVLQIGRYTFSYDEKNRSGGPT